VIKMLKRRGRRRARASIWHPSREKHGLINGICCRNRIQAFNQFQGKKLFIHQPPELAISHVCCRRQQSPDFGSAKRRRLFRFWLIEGKIWAQKVLSWFWLTCNTFNSLFHHHFAFKEVESWYLQLRNGRYQYIPGR
jgi:hypothetical protein